MILQTFLLFIQIILNTVLANTTDTLGEDKVRSTADAFDKRLINSKYFVDKTGLLKDLFTLPFTSDFITCPRGFGKTTNLRMIEKFSQIEFDKTDVKPWKETRAYRLFGRLEIFQHEAIVNQHLGRHPVIFLDLGFNLEGPITMQKVITSLNLQLNKYLDYFRPKLRQWYFKEIKSKAISDFAIWTNKILQENIQEADTETSLHSFALTLHHCFGTKVIILIDGFDYFVNHAFKSAENIGCIYSMLNKLVKTLFVDLNHRLYILMAGTTSIAFEHNHFNEYLKPHSFLDEHVYTRHFGFNEDDLRKLFEIYASSKEEMAYIKKYYAGYKIADKYVKYNPLSITDYFQTKEISTAAISLDTFQRPGQKSIFISKFFKNPYYLGNVTRLIKHCSVRGKFKRTYEPKAYKPFIKYVKNNFRQINVSKSEMMFTFSIEQGFFAPVEEDTYIIANYEMRNHIMVNLRQYYKTQALLDLPRISSQLRQIVLSDQLPSDELKYEFSRTLTAEFKKLVDLHETNLTATFILQSIIHVAARFNRKLNVLEDFPTPVFYNDTKEYEEKRCVTLITGDDVALIVKVTRGQSIQAALYKASNYQYDADESIKHVRYLGIDVNFQNKIIIAIQAQNQTT